MLPYIILVLLSCTLDHVESCRPSCTDEGHTSIQIADDKSNVIDLTYSFNISSAYWPNNKFGFSLTNKFATNSTADDVYYATNSYQAPEHAGTHLDAPSHFAFGALEVHRIPFTSLMGRGVLIDMEEEPGTPMNRSGLVEVKHLEAWEKENDRKISKGDIVFLHTGYGRYYLDRKMYMGTNKTGEESIPFISFPGLHPNAASWLVERNIAAVGIDTASIDYGQSTTFTTHRILAANQIPGLENVANLHKLKENSANFYVIALPMKIEHGTGAPSRVIAIIQ